MCYYLSYQSLVFNMEFKFSHLPVMPREVISGLNIENSNTNKIIVDGTLGGGGHSNLILNASPNIKLIGIDKDADALRAAGERLKEFKDRIIFVHDDFKNIKNILKNIGIEKIDGALLDLGVSSYQLDNYDRGFSYRSEEHLLDMRMDQRQELSAFTVINTYSEQKLREILFKYGEEKFAPRIASNIIKARLEKEIKTCGELAEIAIKSIPAAKRRTGGNPSKRTFQAIRIEVNGELSNLDTAVKDYTDSLSVGGRLCIITFHSLEDRIVKHSMKQLATGCICPPKTPICICNNKAGIKLVTSKPIEAAEDELAENKRSTSAKLRVCEKL